MPSLCALSVRRLGLLCALMFLAATAGAQHPLVGTWEMVSIKGLNVDGEPFFIDTTTVRETKIITPTHYMLVARDVQGDSLVFNRSYAGGIRIEGNHYEENPIQASVQIFDNVKTDFTWKVEGDYFTQSGTFTRPDGKRIVLEAMIFRRVKPGNYYPKNPSIGTWSQLSSTFTSFDGTKGSHTRETTERLQVITPTHWMRISHRDGKFEHVILATYTMRNGTMYPTIVYSSTSFPPLKKTELSDKVQGDKLYSKGKMTTTDNRVMTWDDVFERVQ